MKLKKGKAAPSLSGSYGKAVKNKKTSLFYFYSPQCGACKTMTPIVAKYTKNNSRCFKIDITKDRATASAFGIMATPSTAIVENGIIKDFIVGPRPLSEFENILEQTRA
ncbi:MAG: thioredoxin family protein [Spirochaetales bacterium]|uniref:Thioredoxin family protein n=1 Tax=Candidatus Thalassospirochaeta sargassi TaxID=3119039 RepID=A0AAJ1IFQ2_9SPIO|nr:thioredoxin family protein [Spirochaetales bacterium]